MKKILGSVGVLAVVGALVLGATGAFFSDTETSTGNTFTAGAIDLKVDSEQHYNGNECVDGVWEGNSTYPVDGTSCGGTWGQDGGLNIIAEKFFNFGDIKPGDSGENTISLHVVNNDAYICGYVTNLTNDDNGLTEPESLVDQTNGVGNGELQNQILMTVWRDNGNNPNDPTDSDVCDNVQQEDEFVYADHVAIDSNTGGWLLGKVTGDKTVCLGVAWELPEASGNETQTDSVTADISFYTEQYRNNEDFQCPDSLPGEPTPEVHRLVLDNEIMVGDPWTTTPTDQIGGVLTWAGDGPTFDYSVTASGLSVSTNYSLIYYADPYPGNNPGALIGTGSTDSSGNLAFSGTPNLGIDLPTAPDTNIAAHSGAKIWLIPSANYDAGTKSVTPWTPDNTWLFEGNVYINYNDTNN